MSKVYLFRGPHLFANDENFLDKSEEPEPMTLRCINVTPKGNNNFMGASRWDFQIEGRGDRWYHTYYEWALVEDTPENIELDARITRMREQQEILQRQITLLGRQITDVKTVSEREA